MAVGRYPYPGGLTYFQTRIPKFLLELLPYTLSRLCIPCTVLTVITYYTFSRRNDDCSVSTLLPVDNNILLSEMLIFIESKIHSRADTDLI